MAIKYCELCKRPVEGKRKFGIGTLIGVLASAGLWLLALPFYQKRCSICGSTALSDGYTDRHQATQLGQQLQQSQPVARPSGWISQHRFAATVIILTLIIVWLSLFGRVSTVQTGQV